MSKQGRPPGQGPTCQKGHERTPENTYTTPGGTKVCRICRRLAVQGYKARRKVLEERFVNLRGL